MVISGKVIIINNKKDYYKIKEGAILVAKNTHPELAVVINKIKAIVTEIDNKLCHAAIIAREFNKPLLMGAEKATKKFKTGDRVTVDINNKTINKTK